jgi:hypothetical protein
MTSYYVEFIFDMGGPFDEATETHLDEVAEAFLTITDVDGDVGVNLKARRVELCMTLDAADRPEALLKAFVAARTAVHAAGGGTATWDGWLRRMLDDDEFTSSVSRSSANVGCTA